MDRDRASNDDRTAGRAREVFDERWEAGVRAVLEQAGFDADLAVRAARDTLALLGGDLTEHEFHARHHEAYLREFGRDDRPRGGDASELSAPIDNAAEGGAPPHVPAGGRAGVAQHAVKRDGHPAPLSRRAALKLAGGGAAALSLGQMAAAPSLGVAADGRRGAGGADAPDGASTAARPVRWGMVIDLDRCNGCLFCVAGCERHNGLPDGVHWVYVLSYSEPDASAARNELVRTCQHCSNAPCVKVCPVAARHAREDGLVLTDYDICIGCRYCEVACPYGVNYFQWADSDTYGGGFTGDPYDGRGRRVIGDPPKGVMGKCTFCPERQDSPELRGTSVCELACPHDVMHFGDLNDPESKPNRYLRERRNANGGTLHTFRLLDDLGTEPNVIFIGSPPSRRAEPVEPRIPYEERGFVETRRTVLEGPEPWFLRMVRRG